VPEDVRECARLHEMQQFIVLESSHTFNRELRSWVTDRSNNVS
jgi:hypothetical protein